MSNNHSPPQTRATSELRSHFHPRACSECRIGEGRGWNGSLCWPDWRLRYWSHHPHCDSYRSRKSCCPEQGPRLPPHLQKKIKTGVNSVIMYQQNSSWTYQRWLYVTTMSIKMSWYIHFFLLLHLFCPLHPLFVFLFCYTRKTHKRTKKERKGQNAGDKLMHLLLFLSFKMGKWK